MTNAAQKLNPVASDVKEGADEKHVDENQFKKYRYAAADLKNIERGLEQTKGSFSLLSLSHLATVTARSVAEGINARREQLSSTFRQVTKNVIESVYSLTETSRSLDEIQSETRQLADYSSTIASAAEELGATIDSISGNLQNTIDSSGEAKKIAEQGTGIIDSTQQRILDVNNTFQHANDALTRLLEAANQADKIIRVVNDISSKTDLLALNASIEAARAGEAGKGFAVVAHEVSRLSEKTQDSISDIEGIIENLKREIGEVSQKIGEGTDSANQASADVEKSKNTIKSIVDKINVLDNEVANIGAAVKEQSQAVSDIASNVQTISKGSRGVNEKVSHIADNLDQATKRSNATRGELGKLKLTDNELIEHSKIDHLFWMHRLRRMIEGKETIKQEEFTDHTVCRLGKWYYAVDVSAMGDRFSALHKELEPPHAKLHTIAAQVIAKYNQGEKQEALKLYKQCLPISEQILHKLDALLKSIEG